MVVLDRYEKSIIIYFYTRTLFFTQSRYTINSRYNYDFYSFSNNPYIKTNKSNDKTENQEDDD